jgi:hypothetical protein
MINAAKGLVSKPAKVAADAALLREKDREVEGSVHDGRSRDYKSFRAASGEPQL